jgi:hypothetical protein
MAADGDSWRLVVDWRDGDLEDAQKALHEVLAECGIDPSSLGKDDVKINYGSYRGNAPPGGYFRVWLRSRVLSADT